MSFLSRILGTRRDPREDWRKLWHGIVETAREPQWYADCGVADTVEGRFDMVTLVLAVAMLRMERNPELRGATALLTEIFVEDMDGQLRQQGVGDHLVGKHVGRLMGTLGGRVAAYRKGLSEVGGVLTDALRRNVSLDDAEEVGRLAQRVEELSRRFERTSDAELRRGEIAA